MNKKLLSVAFALMFATITVAEDAPAKKKKRDGAARRNAPAAALLKQLNDAGLTDEQKAKIVEMAKKASTEMQTARKEAGITPELMKKRAAAAKELRESGKKPADINAAVSKKLSLTEAQVAVFKKQTSQRAELRKNAVALLTDEQKAKLPKRLTRTGNRKAESKDATKGKGKGKKKKSDDR